jgi:predicted GNAT family acetyltransferase
MPGTGPRAQVTRDDEASRFKIRVGGEVAGYVEYRRRGNLIAFVHTVMDPRFDGQGLATRLLTHALDAAREEGVAVQPFCPCVRDHIAEHLEYLDLVPAANRSSFDLPERA